jgi:DNA-binding transcriptional MocR family regulator
MDTRTAKQIARELYSLIKAENPYTGEELLSASSLCQRLDISRSWFDHRAKNLPRVVIGGACRYPLNRVIEQLNINSL